MSLTKEGYVKRSPDEIKQAMIDDLEKGGGRFLKQPADVQNNLLDSGVVLCLQFENMVAEMLNGYAPEYANDFIWINLANSLGLTKKLKQKSQVELKFTGNPGVYIPEGTTVGAFETTKTIVLGTTGEALVLATSESDEIAAANTLTEIGEIIDPSLQVINPNASIPETAPEDINSLRKRARVMLRSARKGAYEFALAKLGEVDGVNTRLLRLRQVDYNVQEKGPEGETILRNIQGIEAIVGGGDPYEIAGVLKESFLETKKLLSLPSDDETDRTAKVEIKYYKNIINVLFTRPKNIDLDIRIYLTLKNNVVTQTSAEGILKDPIEKFINNLDLGESLNKFTLTSLILNEFNAHSIEPRDFVNIDYKITSAGKVLEWTDENFLEAVKFDCYLTLSGFSIDIL